MATAGHHHEVWTPSGRRRVWTGQGGCGCASRPSPNRSYMLYSTMMPPWWRRVLAWGLGRRSASDPGILALGTLAPGPGGHEPILSPERLARDLDLALEVASNPPATVPHDAAFCTVLPRCHAPAEQR